MVLIIQEGNKSGDVFFKNATLLGPSSNDNIEFVVLLTIIKRVLEGSENNKWNKLSTQLMGASEKITIFLHLLYIMEKEDSLLVPTVDANDSVTKSKFDNIYWYKHSLSNGIMRVTDVMIAEKMSSTNMVMLVRNVKPPCLSKDLLCM